MPHSTATASLPFKQLCTSYQIEPIEQFDASLSEAREYIDTVQGQDISDLFIGWLCIPDTFFAYLFRRMKREVRERQDYSLAEQIAHDGFPVLVKPVAAKATESAKPVMVIPVPSKHGVSELFADVFQDLLQETLTLPVTQIRPVVKDPSAAVDIKKAGSWELRARYVKELFRRTSQQRDLSGYTVILVDDIITSGASLQQAAAMIKMLGAQDIIGVCLTTNLYHNREAQ